MAEPSILMVAPKGMTNRAMVAGTRPEFEAHWSETGIVAALLAQANAVV